MRMAGRRRVRYADPRPLQFRFVARPIGADRSGDIVPIPRAHNMLFFTLFAAFTAVFVACHAWTITRSAD